MKIASYEISRVLISGLLFWLGYILHRRFSFRDYKKVGVAIYSTGVERLEEIVDRIKDFPDFIHVDIVDHTFLPDCQEVLSYKTEVIKAYWRHKFIECHIMSKNPSHYIDQISANVHRIYVHLDIEEDLSQVLQKIKSGHSQPGLVIRNQNDLDRAQEYLNQLEAILVLAIEKPGFSGQQFNLATIELIKKIDELPHRNRIELTVDGGVNAENIKYIRAENVVSGSFVLNAEDCIKQIMTLQTSSQYESI